MTGESHAVRDTPELARLFGLAREIARPVARGWLPGPLGNACLLLAALSAERTSGADFADLHSGARHITRQHIRRERQEREMTAYEIARALQPLLGVRTSGDLLAEARYANKRRHDALTEREVVDVVRAEAAWFMERRRRDAA